MIDFKKPKVTVVMITYNHEKFIEQAIYGVLNQKCNFEFELIILNDNSPDNTDFVIRQIIDRDEGKNEIRYYNNPENVGVIENFLKGLKLAKGEYIALCEGDDYWTDSLKLNTQVSFLMANPDYGLVHTDCDVYIQNEGVLKYKKTNFNKDEDPFIGLMLNTYEINTLTTCIVTRHILDYLKDIKPELQPWKMGDLPLWLYISKKSKIKYLDIKTSVYRVLQESASNTNDPAKKIAFEGSIQDIKLYFLDYFKIKDKQLYLSVANTFLYRKLITVSTLKVSNKLFFTELFQFYIKNRNLRFFLGSFKQVLKKVSKW